ncbi:hypothetical protein HYT57_04830 [Candidatus Woesearchaeota archaeon]|nr:hypothetical protein [Candidatus Woesearchaeota archaeon]
MDVVCLYLNSLKKTIKVKNVEDDKECQKKDIDLIWIYKKRNSNLMISVEVKTDRYTTGNFWLETLSNEKFGTPGCFIKSEAKYLFYYFTGWDSMYIIPLKKARLWFLGNFSRFKESTTTTKDENGDYKHTTVGRLVPISVMVDEVKGIKLVKDVTKKINS